MSEIKKCGDCKKWTPEIYIGICGDGGKIEIDDCCDKWKERSHPPGYELAQRIMTMFAIRMDRHGMTGTFDGTGVIEEICGLLKESK